MRRRAMLATVATALGGGCRGLRTSESNTEPEADATEPNTVTGTDPRESKFRDEPCPDITSGTENCSHPATGLDAGIVLVPESDRFAGPTLSFTLWNRSDRAVDASATSRLFARRFDGIWQQIPRQRQDNVGSLLVDAGEIVDVEVGSVDGPPTGRELKYRESFGGGAFAFGVYCDRTTPLARFTVEGEPTTVSPPGRFQRTDRGDRLVLTPERHLNENRTLTLTFTAASASDALEIAPEVVQSRPDLRAALFLEESGIETVEVNQEDDYFRPPVEWLRSANVWRGSDQVYELNGVQFTVAQ